MITTTKPKTAVGGLVVEERKGIFAGASRFVARYAWAHLVVSFVGAIALSYVGMVIGEFSPEIDNEGWLSRGTEIADRSTQYFILAGNYFRLAGTTDNEDTWIDLTGNPQPNYSDSVENAGGDVRRRKLSFALSNNSNQEEKRSIGGSRYLQTNEFDVLCEDDYNSMSASDLAPIWKTKNDISAFDPRVIQDICEAEQTTMNVLFRDNLCQTCGDDKCLAPVSIVLFARVTVGDTELELSCSELAEKWEEKRSETEERVLSCIEEVKVAYTATGFSMPDVCPPGFYTSMVDEDYAAEGNNFVKYTSSIFPTQWGKGAAQRLYDIVDEFDKADNSKVVEGAYDNARESLGLIKSDDAIGTDMLLACASGAITSVAILIHTRSLWLTIIGLFQIILSFPLGYFVYTFIFGLNFFPFLNFIGVFVVFALGADDIFVAVDKWKNARLDYPKATTEQIAAIALPDAANAMLLTTTTTAAAFFGTAICPVAPLKCFAIFVGLLIVFDYFLCILLVFPALCIYDRSLMKGSNCCCTIGCESEKEEDNDDNRQLPESNVKNNSAIEAAKKGGAEAVVDHRHNLPEIIGDSFIRRVLLGYYFYFHKVRWIVFALSLGGTIVSGLFAAGLQLPENSDVRLLNENLEYEKNYSWRLKLLSTVLEKSGGSEGGMVWGVVPADTGSHVDPASGTKLVLDPAFDPSTMESQEYLLNFCDRFFEQEFASLISENFACPFNTFNEWLVTVSSNNNTTTEDNLLSIDSADFVLYDEQCNGATGLPMPQKDFNSCITAWAVEKSEQSLLLRNGAIEGIFFFFQGRVRFDSPFQIQSDEWELIEGWLDNEKERAPEGVKKMFQTSIDFWWFDTNGSMLRSAYASAGIAMAVSGVIIFVSSRSFILTLFALLTIAYVLVSTTAMLVASGWTLGFLESICFAILIGISCDFVIHFCHAYAHIPGNVDRHYRTKYALVRMGPSILAAAFTTVCAATIMLFTVISFFQQFALILFYTIIQATVGSFVVFVAFTDCIGPSNPTYLVDSLFSSKKDNEGNAMNEKKEEQPPTAIYPLKQQQEENYYDTTQSSNNHSIEEVAHTKNFNPNHQQNVNASLPTIDMSEKHKIQSMDYWDGEVEC